MHVARLVTVTELSKAPPYLSDLHQFRTQWETTARKPVQMIYTKTPRLRS